MRPCCLICPLCVFCAVSAPGTTEEELRALRVISNRHTGEIKAIREALIDDGISVGGSIYVKGQKI